VAPLTVALLLFAALLHASWNAILRSGSDRLWSITVMTGLGGVMAMVFDLALGWPAPDPSSWPFIAGSTALQIGYCLFIVRAYRDGHLGHVYPIARGTAPLLVTLGAWIVAGEHLSGPALAGVLLVSAGIMTLAIGRDRPDLRTVAAAVGSGAFVASYMVVDGLGVRHSGHPLSYAAWLTGAQGLAMTATFAAIRRRLPALPAGRGGGAVLVGAAISTLAYGVALWAMSGSAMAQVSALRETSILFAAILGALWLREPITARRLIGGASIAAGAFCLAAL
jgi:drug/metabolite transporter (DMT)-like permease